MLAAWAKGGKGADYAALRVVKTEALALHAAGQLSRDEWSRLRERAQRASAGDPKLYAFLTTPRPSK